MVHVVSVFLLSAIVVLLTAMIAESVIADCALKARGGTKVVVDGPGSETRPAAAISCLRQ
jgi:hypothetical protein